MVTGPPASSAVRPAGYPDGGPPLVSRAAARGLARTELAKPGYHQGVSFTDRVIQKIISFLGRLPHLANADVPGGWWGVLALGALAVIVIGVLFARLGPVSLAHRARGAALGGDGMATARDHRVRAQELAAGGDWSGAIRATLRAIAADLEERAILPPRAGRTADELAVEAGRALPGHGGALRSAAQIFDDVCYGQRPGTADGYARLRDLDATVRAARPVPLGSAGERPAAAPGLAATAIRGQM